MLLFSLLAQKQLNAALLLAATGSLSSVEFPPLPASVGRPQPKLQLKVKAREEQQRSYQAFLKDCWWPKFLAGSNVHAPPVQLAKAEAQTDQVGLCVGIKVGNAEAIGFLHTQRVCLCACARARARVYPCACVSICVHVHAQAAVGTHLGCEQEGGVAQSRVGVR